MFKVTVEDNLQGLNRAIYKATGRGGNWKIERLEDWKVGRLAPNFIGSVEEINDSDPLRESLSATKPPSPKEITKALSESLWALWLSGK